MKKFDIIMFNMSDYSDWNDKGIVNRNYFILHKLLKSENIGKILAIDLLPHNLKRGIKKYFTRKQYKSYKLIERSLWHDLYQVEENLYVYSSVESVCTACETKMYDKINKIVENLGFKNIINWSYLPTFTNYFDKVKSDIKIFDAVDNWSEHGSYKNIRKRLIKNYKKIDEQADIIFTVSGELKKIFKTNKNIHWIPNGVDAQHFDVQEKEIAPADIKDIKKPIIGYVGIVQDRFNIELMEYLLRNNQDKSFIIIGMVWPEAGIERLANFKNIYLLGQKKYQELPKYIKEFDVAIIPHKINEFTKSMNPMKLYEYLAAGKPIITTKIAGSEKFKDLIEITESREDFNNKIDNIIKENNLEKIQARKNIAQKNSWDIRVNKMLEIINNFRK